MQDAVGRLQDLIYDSIASPMSWADVTSGLGALAGASSTLIFDTTRGPEDGGLWVAQNVAAEAAAQYVAHYGSIDVWIEAAVAGGFPRLGNIWAVAYAFEPDRAAAPALGERLAAFFGLTPAERRVAGQLLQDRSPSEIAEDHRVSLETVRTQIKSLFAKTGTSRQSQLVRRLMEVSLMPRGGLDG